MPEFEDVVKGTQEGAQASQSGLAKGPVRYTTFLAVFCEQKLACRNQKIIEKFAVAGSHFYHKDQNGAFVRAFAPPSVALL